MDIPRLHIDQIQFGEPGQVEAIQDSVTGEVYITDKGSEPIDDSIIDDPTIDASQVQAKIDLENQIKGIKPKPQFQQQQVYREEEPYIENNFQDDVNDDDYSLEYTEADDEWEDLIDDLEDDLEAMGHKNGLIPNPDIDGDFIDIRQLSREDVIRLYKQVNYFKRDQFTPKDPTLAKLIEFSNETGRSIDDIVSEIATERAAQLMEEPNQDISIMDMSDEDVIRFHISLTTPGISDLEEDQRVADEMRYSTFASKVASLRQQYRNMELDMIAKEKYEEQQRKEELLENEKYKIVRAIEDVNGIGGINLTDDVKNYILDDILNVDKVTGESPFFHRLKNSPEMLFKLAFYDNYSNDIEQLMEDAKRKSYEAGKAAAYREFQQSNITPRQTYIQPQQRQQVRQNTQTIPYDPVNNRRRISLEEHMSNMR